MAHKAYAGLVNHSIIYQYLIKEKYFLNGQKKKTENIIEMHNGKYQCYMQQAAHTTYHQLLAAQ